MQNEIKQSYLVSRNKMPQLRTNNVFAQSISYKRYVWCQIVANKHKLLCLKFLVHLRTKTDSVWNAVLVWSVTMEIVLKHISDILQVQVFVLCSVFYSNCSIPSHVTFFWKRAINFTQRRLS
jgi:hypothetical protein